jgi:hypothetical protein
VLGFAALRFLKSTPPKASGTSETASTSSEALREG